MGEGENHYIRTSRKYFPRFRAKTLDSYRAVVLASEMYTHLVPDRRIRATIKPTLGERIRTNTLKAFTDNIKITEAIGDRVGGYNFSPTLIASRSRRKQCPLYSANPHGQTESSFLGYAGSDRCIKDWSPHSLRVSHHKPIDSSRVDKGQSSCRGRVRCQSLFIAGERRRCEPDSKPVIATNALTSVEGHCRRDWRPTTHAEDFCRLFGNPPHLGPVTGAYRVPV